MTAWLPGSPEIPPSGRAGAGTGKRAPDHLLAPGFDLEYIVPEGARDAAEKGIASVQANAPSAAIVEITGS
ncbi:DUF1508 domain-containing protein [Nocardia sp. NPDC001965]